MCISFASLFVAVIDTQGDTSAGHYQDQDTLESITSDIDPLDAEIPYDPSVFPRIKSEGEAYEGFTGMKLN